MSLFFEIMKASWEMLLESSIYILFGLLVGGVLKVFLSPAHVANHLGKSRYSSVLKAALIGIPLPLCSCGVLPAAASLKKQGANNGATTAFLISTPESGVDSISITYALLDPLMTVARPVAAFLTALSAGLLENMVSPPQPPAPAPEANPFRSLQDGHEQPSRPSLGKRIGMGIHSAVSEVWGDLAGWFFLGLLLGGIITVMVPDSLITSYMGGGLISMLIMLAVGIPVYICATASTPIAAALILKGVSPGAALVFLLVGPATNMASLAMVASLLGKKATIRYLFTISLMAVGFGLAVDRLYLLLGLSARAVAGNAAEVLPHSLEIAGAFLLLALSLIPFRRFVRSKLTGTRTDQNQAGCGCSGSCGK